MAGEAFPARTNQRTPRIVTSRSRLDDAEYWRKRAKEIRDLAGQVGDFHARNEILRIAEDYDRLAERAEERAEASKKP
jgi:hypothetical protein